MADNWQPFPLPDGSYSDDTRPWSAQDLVNYLPVNAEQGGTLSTHKLRTAPGMKRFAYLGTKPVRGMHDVEGRLYAVAGNSLYRLYPDGTQDDLGAIPGTGRVQMVHNQVAGGNQLVIATRNNGTWVYADEGAEQASGNPGGSPGGNPGGGTGGGGGGGVPVVYTREGTEGDTTLGPNGGFADNAPMVPPYPSVFGTNVIADGDFTNAGDMTAWKTQGGAALNASNWFVDGGRAHYFGLGDSRAFYYPAKFSYPYMPFPRFSVTVTAKVQCDPGVKVSVGLALGYSTGSSGGPTQLEAIAGATYASETTISHTFELEKDSYAETASGYYVVPYAIPVLVVEDSSGTQINAYFDDVTCEFVEIAPDTTVQTIDHLGFDDDLTGWVKVPMENDYSPTITVTGGEVMCEPASSFGIHQYLINVDPIAGADEIGKYIRISGDVLSNDTETQTNRATNGVAFGLAVYDGVTYTVGPFVALPLRGDWTPRSAWFRQLIDSPGFTYHAAVLLRCKVGKKSGVRNLVVEVTDEVID